MKSPSWQSVYLAVAVSLLWALPGATSQVVSRKGQSNQAVPPKLSPQDVFKRVAQSVFIVETLDAEEAVVGQGSGVVVGPGQVITNKHVIDTGIFIRVRQGARTWPAVITHLDADRDLCRLRVEGLNARSVRVRRSSTVQVGERVFAVGAPAGLELTLSEGLVSGLRQFEGHTIIQTSAAISPGSSGGGLFDLHGRLVGITTLRVREGENLGFAVPAEWLFSLDEHRFGEESILTDMLGEAKIWDMRGRDAYAFRHYVEAIEAFKQSIRLEPEDIAVWNRLCHAYLFVPHESTEMREQTLKVCRQGTRLEPDNSNWWHLLGFAHNVLRQNTEAVEAYEQAIQLDPEKSISWGGLAGVYARLRQYDKAIAAYQEALRLSPGHFTTWEGLGFTYMATGRFAEAVDAYKEAIRTLREEGLMVANTDPPLNVELWLALADAHANLGQSQEAVRVYNKALELRPDYAGAWLRFGNFHLRKRDYGQALKAYEKANSLKPGDAPTLYNLGVAYDALHNRSEVTRIYRQLKSIDLKLAEKFFREVVLP